MTMTGGPERSPPGVPSASQRVVAPARLQPQHDVSSFTNERHPALDDWLRNRALASEGLSARTYVTCDAAVLTRVAGYFALSMAMEQRVALPSAKLRRGMPDQVPLVLIGRLAVDSAYQEIGIGAALLADALRRCLAASEIAGTRGIVAHAIDDEAARFYQHHGFLRSAIGERVMLLPIETLRAGIE